MVPRSPAVVRYWTSEDGIATRVPAAGRDNRTGTVTRALPARCSGSLRTKGKSTGSAQPSNTKSLAGQSPSEVSRFRKAVCRRRVVPEISVPVAYWPGKSRSERRASSFPSAWRWVCMARRPGANSKRSLTAPKDPGSKSSTMPSWFNVAEALAGAAAGMEQENKAD